MYQNTYLIDSSTPSLAQKGMEYIQRANQDSSSPTSSLTEELPTSVIKNILNITIRQLEGYHHYALNLPSLFSFASCFAVGSLSAVFSVFSVLSYLSFLSVNSILSVASVNSVLSIGCVNSILTICDPRDMNYRAAVAETPMATPHDPHHPTTNPMLQFVLDGQRRPPADDPRAMATTTEAPTTTTTEAPDYYPSEDLCPCASKLQSDLGWMDWVSMAPVRGMMDDVYGYFDGYPLDLSGSDGSSLRDQEWGTDAPTEYCDNPDYSCSVSFTYFCKYEVNFVNCPATCKDAALWSNAEVVSQIGDYCH